MKERIIEIETSIGYIRYRDTIFLDKIESNNTGWIFSGELNGRHIGWSFSDEPFARCIDAKADTYYFRLTFKNVVSMFHYDQEVSATKIYSGFIDIRHNIGCFYKVENSKFLNNVPIQEQDKDFIKELSHFVLRTYDEAFHIIAKAFELETSLTNKFN